VISGLAVLFVIIIISCLGATGIKEGMKVPEPSTWLSGSKGNPKWNNYAGSATQAAKNQCGGAAGRGAWWGNGEKDYRCCPLDGNDGTHPVYTGTDGNYYCSQIPWGLPCSDNDQCAGNDQGLSQCFKYTEENGSPTKSYDGSIDARLCMPNDQTKWPTILAELKMPQSAISQIWTNMQDGTGTQVLQQSKPTTASGQEFDKYIAPQTPSQPPAPPPPPPQPPAPPPAPPQPPLGPGGEGPPNTFPRPPSTNTTHGKKLARLSCAVYPA